MKKILLYGFGNIGRQDDGLGVLLVQRMEDIAVKNGVLSMDFEANYQLNIEDSLLISQYDVVYFADAAINCQKDVEIIKPVPSSQTEFTMHAMSPAFILHLCNSLYDRSPETYLITMRGYSFEFGLSVTEQAVANLDAAMVALIQHVAQQYSVEFSRPLKADTFTLKS